MVELNNSKTTLTPLKQIRTDKGYVFHGLKSTENTFKGFGEAYFSFVDQGTTKGWKLHKEMTLNLIVPRGLIKFVVYDPKEESFSEFTIGEDNYNRLTISPGLWVAFRGIKKVNMLLNIANIEHNPDETISKELSEINYEWN